METVKYLQLANKQLIKVLISAVALLTCALVDAQTVGGGGHYDVTYYSTNGLWTSTGSAGSASGPYTPTTTSVGASAVSGGLYIPPGLSGGSYGTAGASGTVFAHYVWNSVGNTAAYPAPQCAIVKETATASWSGTSGACDDSLGGGATQTSPYGGSATGIRYSVHQEDAADFTVSCSPSASVISSQMEEPNLMSGQVSVGYTTTLFIPKLTLSGVLSATDKRILVSEGLGATVVTGGLDAGSPKYAWGITGGKPFADYTATTDNGHKTDFVVPGTDKASLLAYISKKDHIDISCTVTITSPSLSFTLKDTAESVNPTFTSVTKYIGTFRLMPNATNPTIFKLNGVAHPFAPSITVGICTDFWVQTPPDFVSGPDVGTFTIAQVMTNRSISDGTRVYMAGQDYGIDNRFPYYGYDWKAATALPTNAATRVWLDSPGIWGNQELKYDADFSLYIFYAGPNNSKIVAFQQLNWFGKGTATNVPPWQGVDGLGPEDKSRIDGTWIVNPDHPQWVRALHNSGI